MTRLELAERRVAHFERLCTKWAASEKPWALKNLRLYQNYYSDAVGELCAAERDVNC